MPSPDRVRARSVGYLVHPWRAATGSVHSAYRGAVNLILSGQLRTLVPEDLADGPCTVRLDAGGFSRLAAARRGDPVAMRGASLAVAGAVVDLRTAKTWRPPDPPARFAGDPRHWDLVRSAALAHGGAPWIGAAVRSAMAPDGQARAMLGRGVGLTPSGDDAVVGALAVCWAMRLAEPAAASAHALLAGRAIAGLSSTTDLSAAFLGLAAQGHFQRPVWEAALTLAAGPTPDAIPALLEVGATSGADCALGMVSALETLSLNNDKVAA